MIIFDLDTLADCEHRRHFVDDKYSPPDCKKCENTGVGFGGVCYCYHGHPVDVPDFESFYDACDKDNPIFPTWFCFNHLVQWHENYQVWSNLYESYRKKVINFLMNKCPLKPTYWNEESWNFVLKMRPIGDNTPYHELKEKWLDERIDDMGNQAVSDIDFVFDSDPKSIEMWKRRGIFVFDCNQSGSKF